MLLEIDKLNVIRVELGDQVQGVIAIALFDESEPLHEVQLVDLKLPFLHSFQSRVSLEKEAEYCKAFLKLAMAEEKSHSLM